MPVNNPKNAQSPDESWKTADPTKLSDADLIRRVRRDKPQARLAQFAALAVVAGSFGYGMLGGRHEDKALEKVADSPAIWWSGSGHSMNGGGNTGLDAPWDGVNEKTALNAKFDTQADAGWAQTTDRAARAGTDMNGEATLVIDTQAAAVPAVDEGKGRFRSAQGFAPAQARWGAFAGEAVTVERIGPTRWRIHAKDPEGQGGTLWAYAGRVAQTSDGPLVEGVVGFATNARIEEAQRMNETRSRLAGVAFAGTVAGLAMFFFAFTCWRGRSLLIAKDRADISDAFSSRLRMRREEQDALAENEKADPYGTQMGGGARGAATSVAIAAAAFNATRWR
jgi:hypothetical protein